MRATDIMTTNPVCCNSNTTIREAASLMIENDFGSVPIVDPETRKLVGVLTDRDIVCRAVAQGLDPKETAVSDCMSEPVVSVTPDTDFNECCNVMEREQIRRLPVLNEAGYCCGIISQADISQKGSPNATAEVVRKVSEPNIHASQVRCH